MLSSPLLRPLGTTRIYLYAKPADLRKSFDGLHAIVQSEFGRDIRLGGVFLFLNRRLDRIKLIHWACSRPGPPGPVTVRPKRPR